MASSDIQWLYKQAGLILGPITQDQLEQKIVDLEVPADAEVRKVGSDKFVKLESVGAFAVALAKAGAKHRVNVDANAREKTENRTRLFVLSGLLVLLIVIAVGVSMAGKYLALKGPLRSNEAAYEDLINTEPVEVSLVKEGNPFDDLVDYPGYKKVGALTARAPQNVQPQTQPNPGRAAPVKGPTQRNVDEEGMESGPQVDQSMLKGVYAQKQKTLHNCLAEVAKGGFRGEIAFEFAITNNGKVSQLWVDKPPEFKNGPLKECLLGKLKEWQFPKFEGDTVTLNAKFKIGEK